MQVAREYVAISRRRKALEGQLAAEKKKLGQLGAKLLEHMEHGRIPASFRLDGASVFAREQLWASPKDGDHQRLASVLKDLGLTEFLPRTVNSQSISAYVREHINDSTGEVEGLDSRLLEALNLSTRTNAVVNFGG